MPDPSRALEEQEQRLIEMIVGPCTREQFESWIERVQELMDEHLPDAAAAIAGQFSLAAVQQPAGDERKNPSSDHERQRPEREPGFHETMDRDAVIQPEREWVVARKETVEAGTTLITVVGPPIGFEEILVPKRSLQAMPVEWEEMKRRAEKAERSVERLLIAAKRYEDHAAELQRKLTEADIDKHTAEGLQRKAAAELTDAIKDREAAKRRVAAEAQRVREWEAEAAKEYDRAEAMTGRAAEAEGERDEDRRAAQVEASAGDDARAERNIAEGLLGKLCDLIDKEYAEFAQSHEMDFVKLAANEARAALRTGERESFSKGQRERAALALRDSWRNPASGDSAVRQLNTARKQVQIVLSALSPTDSPEDAGRASE